MQQLPTFFARSLLLNDYSMLFRKNDTQFAFIHEWPNVNNMGP